MWSVVTEGKPAWKLILLALVILTASPVVESQVEQGPQKLNSKDFAQLNLETEELLGSRWAIEQTDTISVHHAVEIVDAVMIDNNQLTLRVEVYIRQRWSADGLEFPTGLFKESDPPGVFIAAKKTALNHMWSPDSYISSSRESNMAISAAPLIAVHIFPNKTILYKTRMYTNVACSANFVWYPLDKQSCNLIIESYKYHDKAVNYQWEDDKLYRPVQIKFDRLLQYDLDTVVHSNGSTARGGRGVHYPFVKVKLVFERQLGNNVIQVFIPTILVVVLSWFSFWLGLDAIPGRITLLITCMLTLVAMLSGLKASIPPVHYITMMDVWLVSCILFVFTSIFEFVTVKYLHWKHQMNEKLTKKLEEDEDQRMYLKFVKTSFANDGIRDRSLSKMKETSNFIVPQSMPSQIENHNQRLYRPRTSMQPFLTESEDGKDSSVKEGRLKKVSVVSSEGFTAKTMATTPEENKRSNSTNFSPDSFSLDPESLCERNSNTNNTSSSAATGKRSWVLIDQFSRVFFPFLFLVFNSIYWPVLFHGSRTQDMGMGQS